ncbi:hypothetical protein PR202_ga13438 [Eleusine coracana subsp. coracana]|uniref:Uncharacterized protein n=1 Tax=Eleusine coracana subsp. coracana TaxID=191504 RepID=A0AAV5CEC2_ELECO|nr:hypothetical protein PR202_ga13438 [Eleusine coracana subsp. coracana]
MVELLSRRGRNRSCDRIDPNADGASEAAKWQDGGRGRMERRAAAGQARRRADDMSAALARPQGGETAGGVAWSAGQVRGEHVEEPMAARSGRGEGALVAEGIRPALNSGDGLRPAIERPGKGDVM